MVVVFVQDGGDAELEEGRAVAAAASAAVSVGAAAAAVMSADVVFGGGGVSCLRRVIYEIFPETSTCAVPSFLTKLAPESFGESFVSHLVYWNHQEIKNAVKVPKY